jgi:mRNA-degrading endonuclease RelE of RelBE toxin-antitoxin system
VPTVISSIDKSEKQVIFIEISHQSRSDKAKAKE